MTRSTPPAARLIVPTIAAILLAMAVVLLRRCLDACGGRFVYPLDDSYIHMAISRNFALHGSWGIEPGAFQPASSSPLWTLMLAGLVRLFGAHDASALALALACMVALVVVLDRLLRDPVPRPLARGAAVLLLCLAIGLPGLTTIGMEPVLHVLLVTPLAWIASRRIVEPAPATRSRWPLGLLAALTVLTRFETLFVIGALGIVALRRRRPAIAVMLGAGGAAALAAYAAFALPQGGPWLPASVLFNAPLMQSRAVDPLAPLVARIPDAFLRERHEHLPVLLIAIAWLLLPRRRVTGETASAARVLLAVTGTTLLLHAQLAGFDSFFRRYEVYWMMLGCFGVVTALAGGLGGLPDGLSERLPRVRTAFVAGLFALGVATPFVIRGHQITHWTPRAAQNIYEQQIQMARFVNASFRGRVVAINDLGAVGYYGGARVIDLCGLASPPVVRAILAHRFDTEFIERYCREEGVEVAMLYESWFRGAARLPDSWTRVARWTIRDNLIAGDAVVTVFATDSTRAGLVREAARRFAPTLPPRVIAEALP